MDVMTIASAPAWLPTGRPFTVADRDALPDDGNRYELIDGALIVTPSPAMRHQRGAFSLARLLHDACPDDLEVFIAPFDVRLSDDTVVVPDIVVARRRDLTEAELPVAPVLAVEVLSPSTRGIDLLLKRDRLRRSGCASYWVVDPLDPRLVAWDLDDRGDYVEVADVGGQDTWTSILPFPVTVTPDDLVR
jgi:Uma2 family endonuclease